MIARFADRENGSSLRGVPGAGLDGADPTLQVRNTLLDHLKHQGWAHTSLLNVIVNGGVVDLWGFSESEAERKAIRIAAEQTPGVCAVNDHLMVQPIARWS